MPSTDYTPEQQQRMLAIARQSIAEPLGLETNTTPTCTEAWLQQPAATFVTLTLNSTLRGCIGCLQAHQSLYLDLQQNASGAAFRDPRFPPLSPREFAEIQIHISILSPCQRLQVDDEADLLSQLRPGTDGLVLEEKHHRATFLPQVWQQLPEPNTFLQHLKLKAGLDRDYWSPSIIFSIYQVIEFSEADLQNI